MSSDEQRVAEYLVDRGFTVQRFEKQAPWKRKSPDFRVFREDTFSFFCEVKSSEGDGWLDKLIQAAGLGKIVETIRKDPVFNRLTTAIHKAVKQFDAVNADLDYPNVLVLINHDRNSGFNDLLAVLTGNFYADDGSVHPIYRQFSEGRIKHEKKRIHMFVWLDDHKPDRFLFSQTRQEHHQTLCSWFNQNQDAIVQV